MNDELVLMKSIGNGVLMQAFMDDLLMQASNNNAIQLALKQQRNPTSPKRTSQTPGE